MTDYREQHQPSTRELAEFEEWLERNPDFSGLRRGTLIERLQRAREDDDGLR